MPSPEVLRPVSTVSNAWPSLSGASAHAATSDNSDTTYIRNNTTTPQTAIFELTDTALTTEVIDSVDIRFRARSETSPVGECQVGLIIGSDETLAANEVTISTSATNFLKANIARPGGGAWTVADINSLRLKAIGDGNTAAIRCFELFVDINYSAGGGGAIKTINGLAKASVKSAKGLAIASVKTWNGLA